MSLWNKDDKLPKYVGKADKKNVIRTQKGWVRRVKKGARVQEEILVTFDGTYTAASPKITAAEFSKSTYATGSNGTLTVSFSEPLNFSNTSGNVKITIANTTGGAVITGVCSANNSLIANANNSLVFAFTAASAGTYGLAAQTLANSTATAISLKSTNSGTANAVLTLSANVATVASSFVVS